MSAADNDKTNKSQGSAPNQGLPVLGAAAFTSRSSLKRDAAHDSPDYARDML